jgi:hypothetical protein
MTPGFGGGRLREDGAPAEWRVWQIRCAAVCTAVVVSVVLAGCGSGSVGRLAGNVAPTSLGATHGTGSSAGVGAGRKGSSVGRGERARARAIAHALAKRDRAVRRAVSRRALKVRRVTSREARAAVRRVSVGARRARQRASVLVKAVVAADPERCLAKAGVLKSAADKRKRLTRVQGERVRAIVLRCIGAAVRADRAAHAAKSAKSGRRS